MRNLGRGLRTIVVLIAVMLVLVFLLGRVLKNVINYEDTVSVLVYGDDVSKGEIIEKEDVKFIKLSSSEVPPTVVTSIDLLSGLYIGEDVFKGEFVTLNSLSEEYPYRISYDVPKGMSLVSVKFDRGDSANAWNIFEGQEVKLIYTPSFSTITGVEQSLYSNEAIIDASVYSIKDAQFYMLGEVEFNPTKLLYVTFLVKEKDAVLISRVKDKGRLEIIQ